MEEDKPLFTEFMTKGLGARGPRISSGRRGGREAAVDGWRRTRHSGTDQKVTFATLRPEVRSALRKNAPEWRALTMSKDAFPALPLEAVRRIRAPTLLLSGQRSLMLHRMIDSQLERLLAQQERIIVSNATHEMWSEYPEECRRAALVFFAKH